MIINNNTNNSCVYKQGITAILDHSNIRSMDVYSDESMKVKASWRRMMETLIKLWWENVSLNIYIC